MRLPRRACAWICPLLLAIPAGAEPYVAARAGAHWWPDTSNRDEIEAGSQPGVDAAVAMGYTVGLRPEPGVPASRAEAGAHTGARSRFALDLEAELAARFDALHGRNHDHVTDERSADGHWLAQGALTLGAWPRVRVAGPVWLRAGAGVGPGFARAFDDVDPVLAWHAGAGVLVELGAVELELGWRHAQTSDSTHDGYALDWEAEAFVAGVRW